MSSRHIRNILITTYILIVLGMSAIARAEVIAIDKAQHVDGSLMVQISGLHLPACSSNLEAIIVDRMMGADEDQVLIELIEKAQPTSLCQDLEPVPRRFEMLLDLKSLGLAAGKNYSFQLLNPADEDFEFEAHLPAGAYGSEFQTYEQSGQLILLGNGDYALIGETAEDSIVFRSLIDLSNYIGREVVIKLLDFKYQVMPEVAVDRIEPFVTPLRAADTSASIAIFISSSMTVDELDTWL